MTEARRKCTGGASESTRAGHMLGFPPWRTACDPRISTLNVKAAFQGCSQACIISRGVLMAQIHAVLMAVPASEGLYDTGLWRPES